MSQFKLGDRVKYRRTLHRAFVEGSGRVWEPYAWVEKLKTQLNPELEGVGIVTGMRTLSNGHVEDYDHGRFFRTAESFQAVVITHHLRRKPVLVRPEDVELLSTPTPESGEES